ncbi:leukocyte specific transcript 1 LST1 transcript variant X2 mRNA [Crotalus adamanteus]|uniref:Leukocyte specific transcript 1 LST1 transcript variant X2 mRNA n=1 Tax=Crotalus adamanteus TaxID=8729 RepID=A0AAW1BV81_CROAD
MVMLATEEMVMEAGIFPTPNSKLTEEIRWDKGKKKSSPITLAMSSIFGGRCLYGCYIPDWAMLVAAVVVFLMLLAIVILSICLCRVCKRVKKRRMSLVRIEGFKSQMGRRGRWY